MLLVYFFCGVFARLRQNIVENVEAFTWLSVERQKSKPRTKFHSIKGTFTAPYPVFLMPVMINLWGRSPTGVGTGPGPGKFSALKI